MQQLDETFEMAMEHLMDEFTHPPPLWAQGEEVTTSFYFRDPAIHLAAVGPWSWRRPAPPQGTAGKPDGQPRPGGLPDDLREVPGVRLQGDGGPVEAVELVPVPRRHYLLTGRGEAPTGDAYAP